MHGLWRGHQRLSEGHGLMKKQTRQRSKAIRVRDIVFSSIF
jgi:hypothetical protein